MKSQATLYLLLGASGAGKSTMASAMVENGVCMFQKKTTRQTRKVDEYQDNEHDARLNDLRGNETFLVYHNNHEAYGIDLPELRRMLAERKNVVMVANNHLMIGILKKMLGCEVKTILIHRDYSQADLESIIRSRRQNDAGNEAEIQRELMTRWSAREILYDQINSGLLQPDFIVINDEIDAAKDQMCLIIGQPGHQATLGGKAPKLHLILAGTGDNKEILLRMTETIPGGRRFLVPKFTDRPKRSNDGAEIQCVEVLPDGVMSYSFFGVNYGICAEAVKAQVVKAGAGFLTVSHIPTAQRLMSEMQSAGIEVKLWYLHQPMPDLSGYPQVERDARLEHYRGLLALYQHEFLVRPDCGVILPISGASSLSSWIQQRLLEANVI